MEKSSLKPSTPAFISRRAVLSTVGTGVGVALAGCSSETDRQEPPPEATITVQLRNRDDEPREFDVVVNQGESLTDSFSGTLPANLEEPIEMIATFRATDEQHDFTISTAGGQRGQTWDPRECGDFLVAAFIENEEPEFTAECRTE